MSDATFKNGLELTQHLLNRGPLDAEDIDKILKTRIREDLHLDYKKGEVLTHPSVTQELRQYISGFANAEGGVLIVGMEEVEERPIAVTGCEPAHVGKPLEPWVNQALSPLVPYLGSAPVVRVVSHVNGLVLVIAVDRAPRLVPCIENGKAVHHLRIGDGTHKIDSYLYADLVLGRRQQPELTIQEEEFHLSQNIYHQNLQCQWTAILLNEGLSWVPDWRAGIIGYSIGDRGAPSSILRRLEILDAKMPIEKGVPFVSLLEPEATDYGPLPPMVTRRLTFPVINLPSPPAQVSTHLTSGACTWMGGLYVVPSNGIPIWAQLQVQFTVRGQAHIGGMMREIRRVKTDCKILPEMERPRVLLEYQDRLGI